MTLKRKRSIKMGPSVWDGTCTGCIGPYQRHINTSAQFYEKIKSILMHQENCQLKPTLLDYSTDRMVSVGCIFKISAPHNAEDCTPQKCKSYFFLLQFIVSVYNSFRFSLSVSASFWTVFVEPGAAPPVHAKNSGTKLLCSTSTILCWYFNVLTLP